MTHVVHPRRSRQFRTFVQLGSIHELCVSAGEGLARGWAVLPGWGLLPKWPIDVTTPMGRAPRAPFVG
jgi:hypothetical protein